MKRILLIFIVSIAFSFIAKAQVRVNVHIYGGNERLYFAHPHSWMVSHGYHYHRNGYYVHHGGRRIHPSRREPYHYRGNNGNHHGQRKMHGRGHSPRNVHGSRNNHGRKGHR